MQAKKTMSEKQLQAVSENGVAVQAQETTYKNTAEPLRVKTTTSMSLKQKFPKCLGCLKQFHLGHSFLFLTETN